MDQTVRRRVAFEASHDLAYSWDVIAQQFDEQVVELL